MFDEYLTSTQDPDISDDEEENYNISMEVYYDESDSRETILDVREVNMKKGSMKRCDCQWLTPL